MDFGQALRALRADCCVSRKGWNGRLRGRNMHLTLHRSPPCEGRLDYIQMYTADDMRVPWVASHTDLLATDWEII